jgi:hypothetical protein
LSRGPQRVSDSESSSTLSQKLENKTGFCKG